MGTHHSALVGLLLSCTLQLTALEAAAASLEPVNDWDRSGLPPDVSMYAYVPDNVGASPPVVVVIHYCGGTAPAVFGQAQGGGLVRAADEYGFILIVPSSGRCWDVVSDAARTRDGSGDSHAIRQMVAHAVAAYGANAERVYATGDSSGGMMTELLLALYPDVFKAAAGCRGDNESGNGGGYSGACAGGNVSRTDREWGDLVRSFSPGHTGARPRVQLFHGDDDDLIAYSNHTEALKQWRDVLGLEPVATSTQSELQLGAHLATRQTWTGGCGRPVLDAFTSLG
jgi:poly(hydroxyalkanoate) depolymerase family esterase